MTTRTPDCVICSTLDDAQLHSISDLSQIDAYLWLQQLGLPFVRTAVRKHGKECATDGPVAQLLFPGAPAPAPEVFDDEAALSLSSLPVMPGRSLTPSPKGWEPGVKHDGTVRTFTLPPLSEPLNESEYQEAVDKLGFALETGHRLVLKEAKYSEVLWQRSDPEEKATTGPAWTYRFVSVLDDRTTAADVAADVDALLGLIGAAPENPAPAFIKAAGETFLVKLADWQCGKRDIDGTAGLIKRLNALALALPVRIRELQSLGRNIEAIVLWGLGDLVEGCAGFYSTQTFLVELDRRQQVRVATRALVHLTKAVAQFGIPVIVTGVPGNHGENRNGAGKAFTNTGDNDDLLVLEMASNAFSLSEGFGHVSFVIPDQQLYLELDLSGLVTVGHHGHVAAGGWAGLWNWFKEQRAHENITARYCIVGHYHHEHFEQDGLLGLSQAPALEGGSEYYTNSRGPVTVPGTGTELVSLAFGVRDRQVL